MTTEIFKAGTQYNDFTGTSAAETQGFSEYLKSKNLIKDDEFVIGIDFFSFCQCPTIPKRSFSASLSS